MLDIQELTHLKAALEKTAESKDWEAKLADIVDTAESGFGAAIRQLKDNQDASPAQLYNAEWTLRRARGERARALGLRRLMNAAALWEAAPGAALTPDAAVDGGLDVSFELSVITSLLERLEKGLEIDWSAIEVLIEDVAPPAPVNNHGTNVAAILGAQWVDNVRAVGPDAAGVFPELPDGVGRPVLTGVCPEVELMDFRVVVETDDGTIAPHDFEVIAAMNMINHLNRRAETIAVHGANLSIAIEHNVRSFACGRTPICEACERLVASGVVVVAAAGNSGYSDDDLYTDRFYRNASIADPGNAEAVITVGSTHRSKPHEYGVSFFSSRGPTGDGRPKPDLVAPGEKIRTAAPGEMSSVVDGTSFSAPHVAGAAALLMERHSELIGKPQRIKSILCNSATDLGRERHFQGAGMLDILRALQSL
ncbi:MAG: S8 family serine peptidase [Pseudomonadota bacterium]